MPLMFLFIQSDFKAEVGGGERGLISIDGVGIMKSSVLVEIFNVIIMFLLLKP